MDDFSLSNFGLLLIAAGLLAGCQSQLHLTVGQGTTAAQPSEVSASASGPTATAATVTDRLNSPVSGLSTVSGSTAAAGYAPISPDAGSVVTARVGSATTTIRSATAGSPLALVTLPFGNIKSSALAIGARLQITAKSDAICTAAALGHLTYANATVQSDGVEVAALSYDRASLIYLRADAGAAGSSCAGPVQFGAGSAAKLALSSGDAQTGYAGEQLPAAVRVEVSDVNGNPVVRTSVSFAVTGGGGSVYPQTLQTDSAGLAAVSWTMGPTPSSSGNILSAVAPSLASAGPLLITAAALDPVCDSPQQDPVFQSGSGNSSDPYIICTAAQLAAIGAQSAYMGASLKVARDLDLSFYDGSTAAKTFQPIGYEYFTTNTPAITGTPFTGTFDGAGHKIANLTLVNPPINLAQGLFSGTSGATITNINLVNAKLALTSPGNYKALLIGYALNTNVSNCTISGTITAASSARIGTAGGAIGIAVSSGINALSSLTAISVTATLQGTDSLAGVCGSVYTMNDGTFIANHLHFSGTITQNMAGGNSFGGVIGYMNAAGGSTVDLSDMTSAGVMSIPLTNGGSWSGGVLAQLSTAGAGTVATLTHLHSTMTINNSLSYTVFAAAFGGVVGQLGANTGPMVTMSQSSYDGTMTVTRQSGSYNAVGLVAGNLAVTGASTITVNDSYGRGTIVLPSGATGSQIGGIIGSFSGIPSINRCYSSVAMIAPNDTAVGGIFGGGAASPAVSNSYWNTDLFAAGFGLGTASSSMVGHSTAELKNEANFIGWDFTNVWTMTNGVSMPTLRN